MRHASESSYNKPCPKKNHKLIEFRPSESVALATWRQPALKVVDKASISIQYVRRCSGWRDFGGGKSLHNLAYRILPPGAIRDLKNNNQKKTSRSVTGGKIG